jgi:hypothetical protein
MATEQSENTQAASLSNPASPGRYCLVSELQVRQPGCLFYAKVGLK